MIAQASIPKYLLLICFSLFVFQVTQAQQLNVKYDKITARGSTVGNMLMQMENG